MISEICKKFLGLWKSGDSTGHQVVRGGFLLFIERAIIKLLQFSQTIVVARILFPHDIGLFGLAALVLSIADALFQTGFNSAIVQYKGDVRRHLDNVWTLNIIRGLFMTALVFFVAPYAGLFFHNNEIIPIAKTLSLLFLISGFQNVGSVLLQKEMRFNKLFFYNTFGNLAQVVVVIVVALVTHSVWALVAGAITLRLAFLALSYIIHPYRPRLDFDLSGVRELFRFGKWIGLAGMVTFFVSQGDSIFIGRLLSASNLAYYNMAFALGTLPVIEIVSSLSNILMPLYSKIDDPNILKDIFLKVLLLVYGVMLPAMAGLIVLAPQIVRTIYGEKWLPMVPILYVICLFGLVSIFDYLSQPLLHGIGKPKIPLVSLISRAVVLFVLIVPLTTLYGAAGTALAMFAGMGISQLITLWKVRKELKLELMHLFKSVYLATIMSLVMGILLFIMKKSFPIDDVFSLVLFILLGILIYVGGLLALDRVSGSHFHKSLVWIKSNI